MIKGVISLPGDKSISHRALMLASLSSGCCIIHNISTGLDIESTRNCLDECGIESKREDNKVYLKGGVFKAPSNSLNCGNSGTTVRLISGLLAGQGISARYIGDESLSKRPMNRIIDPLVEMGAKIESNNGCLPLNIKVDKLKGINFTPIIASAQIKSCIMLAGLGAFGNTTILENIKTRDHTEIMLKKLGASVICKDKISVKPLKKQLDSFEINVPGDPSSAAFFAAAAALIPNSSITIKNMLCNPTRIGFFNLLDKMGCGVEWKNIRYECGEMVGDVHVYWKPLNGIDITIEMVPSIIDELPILAILCSQADSPTIVSGAEELRVKESDRIKAICENLRNMGGDIIEKSDGFIINPVNKLYSANIKTFSDHRIAMAFTIAGLITNDGNILDNSSCINISLPEFFNILKSIQA